MKLIVGLGNPGLEYERTRHNAGWMALDELARRHAAGAVAKSKFHAALLDASIAGEKCLLMKPTMYMNRSGLSVGEAVRFYKLEPSSDMLVLVDDVALPVGEVRVRERGGDGGHNGLADIDRALSGADYPRVRVGIGAVPPVMARADWVLSRFMSEEAEDVKRAIASAADAVEVALGEGVPAAMNRFNRKLSKPAEGGGQKDDTSEDAATSGD